MTETKKRADRNVPPEKVRDFCMVIITNKYSETGKIDCTLKQLAEKLTVQCKNAGFEKPELTKGNIRHLLDLTGISARTNRIHKKKHLEEPITEIVDDSVEPVSRVPHISPLNYLLYQILKSNHRIEEHLGLNPVPIPEFEMAPLPFKEVQ